MRKLIGIIVLMALAINANAVLSMGSNTIYAGTLIEVLEPGPDIQAIIDSIDDASVDKLYLIRLGPGVYDLGDSNIVMKDWVSIQGSGRDVSVIKASITGSTFDAAVIVGANNSSISELSISSIAPTASDGSYGIYMTETSPNIERVNVRVNSDLQNLAIVILDASPTLHDISVTATGIGPAEGIRVEDVSAPVMSNLNIDVSNVASSIGLIAFGSSPEITNSSIKGNFSLWLTSGSINARVVNTKLIGTVEDQAAGTQCLHTYNASLSNEKC